MMHTLICMCTFFSSLTFGSISFRWMHINYIWICLSFSDCIALISFGNHTIDLCLKWLNKIETQTKPYDPLWNSKPIEPLPSCCTLKLIFTDFRIIFFRVCVWIYGVYFWYFGCGWRACEWAVERAHLSLVLRIVCKSFFGFRKGGAKCGNHSHKSFTLY